MKEWVSILQIKSKSLRNGSENSPVRGTIKSYNLNNFFFLLFYKYFNMSAS